MLIRPFSRRSTRCCFARAASTAGKRKRLVSEAAQEDADADTRALLANTILTTLRARSGSMCPSEAPRKLRPVNWRCGSAKARCAHVR